MNNADDVRAPQLLHPAFYGCYDWHSAVHAHWMLIRLLRLFRLVLNRSFTPGNIQNEVKYLDEPNRKTFERTYGWAWLLKLSEELRRWKDPDAQRWASNLEPLAQA